MHRYLSYETSDGGTVLVEIEGEPDIALEGGAEPGQTGQYQASKLGDAAKRLAGHVIEEAKTKFEDAVDAVRQNAQTIIAKVKDISDRPDEVEVTFGLKATGEVGSFAVAKANAEANYKVKLTWKRDKKVQDT